MLSATRLAFADFRGNVQYVSAGNVSVNDRVSLIVMDYPNRQRLKLLGRLRFLDSGFADPELLRAVELPEYRARVERVALIEVAAFDWNCAQHITPRFIVEQLRAKGTVRDHEALPAALRSLDAV